MSAAHLVDLIAATRRAFQALKATGDALHADLGVSASLRAVLEHLEAHGPVTVPDMARAKKVTRQHIQQLVDAGIGAGLAEARPNPAHRRSPLIALTPKGAEVFAEIRKRERKALAALSAELGPDFNGRDAAIAIAALDRLVGALAPISEEGDDT
jgi:DNA-binding MarR family transcriptional regulator